MSNITVKRVVTAIDGGRSVVQEEEIQTPVTSDLMPGVEIFPLWGTEGPIPPYAEKGVQGALSTFFPGPGGTRFGIFTFPPEERDPPAAEAPDPAVLERLTAEFTAKLPDLLGVFEPDNPAFHQTQTIDYDMVIMGTMTLVLDDGVEVELPTGSCVIQNGTRHGWHNYGTEQAAMAYVIAAADAAA